MVLADVKERELVEQFEGLVKKRFEKDGIELPSESVMSRLKWAVSAAFGACVAAAKKKVDKEKAAKVADKKKKKEPKKSQGDMSLKSMGLIQEMTPEDKAREAEEKREAAEREKELRARERLDVNDGKDDGRLSDGHPNALVEECRMSKCKKANEELNRCRIYEEPARAWKHKSGKCPGKGLI